MEIYPCIPAMPQYGYTVCHDVPKSTTVPVPALPILENLRVFPYLCRTLVAEAKAAKKKWQQEAEAEKARQAAQGVELKKMSQVSLQPLDREDDTRMSEVSQASVKHKHAPTITVRTTFSRVSAPYFIFVCFYWPLLHRKTSANDASVRMPLASIYLGASGVYGVVRDICLQLELPFLARLFSSMENTFCSVFGGGLFDSL